MTINQETVDQPYPLTIAEDIFATLAGCEHFTKIELLNAYAQVGMEETSQKYLTINTPKGLYEALQLQYGVKTAPHLNYGPGAAEHTCSMLPH